MQLFRNYQNQRWRLCRQLCIRIFFALLLTFYIICLMRYYFKLYCRYFGPEINYSPSPINASPTAAKFGTNTSVAKSRIIALEINERELIHSRRQMLKSNVLNKQNRYLGWQASGQFGNLLFQYSILLLLAKFHNRTAVLLQERGNTGNPAIKCLGNYFARPLSIPCTNDLSSLGWRKTDPNLTKDNREKDAKLVLNTYEIIGNFDTALFNRQFMTGIDLIFGYPNSYAYFVAAGPQFLNDLYEQFQFKDAILFKALKEMRFLKSKTEQLFTSKSLKLKSPMSIAIVAIHVRGRDMIFKANQPKNQEFQIEDYLIRAIENFIGYFKSRIRASINSGIGHSLDATKSYPIFVLFGDDRELLNNLADGSLKNYDMLICRSRHFTVDMALLSLFNYTILTRGTFGMWSALLNHNNRTRRVIYPKINAGTVQNTITYPPDWIGI